MSIFKSLVGVFRRFFGRRAARRLLAQNLPRGLPDRPLLPALPEPRLPDDAPALEFWTIAIGRRKSARLFRVVALPAPPKRLDVLRELTPRPLAPPLRLPERLEIPAPLESALADLGAARPRSLRLDDELRLPVEVDPLKLPADKAPTRTRRVRPRTPLGRAPINFRLRPRHFRLEENSLRPANEGIVPLEMRDTTYRWIPAAFRRRFLELHWMAQQRISFLGPLQYEWFQMWWDGQKREQPGAKEPHDYRRAEDLDWALEQVKEQMLIRRDVEKDESPPKGERMRTLDMGGLPIRAHERKPPSSFMPEKEWIEPAPLPLPPPTVAPAAQEAYLQWRTLVDALEER